jgi:hypothetical protein
MVAGVAAANVIDSAPRAEPPVLAQEARSATPATPNEKVVSVALMTVSYIQLLVYKFMKVIGFRFEI